MEQYTNAYFLFKDTVSKVFRMCTVSRMLVDMSVWRYYVNIVALHLRLNV